MGAIFANINTPYINDATVRRVMSEKVKENIFQAMQSKPGEGVTENTPRTPKQVKFRSSVFSLPIGRHARSARM